MPFQNRIADYRISLQLSGSPPKYLSVDHINYIDIPQKILWISALSNSHGFRALCDVVYFSTVQRRCGAEPRIAASWWRSSTRTPPLGAPREAPGLRSQKAGLPQKQSGYHLVMTNIYSGLTQFGYNNQMVTMENYNGYNNHLVILNNIQ